MLESDAAPVIINTYRYVWVEDKNSGHINFKYVTDLAPGIKAFEDALLKTDPYSVVREYVSQIDCSRVNEQIVLRAPEPSKEENKVKEEKRNEKI